MDICPVCGLPKELCVCGTIAKETQEIKVYVDKKKFGKAYTIIEGITKDIDKKALLKKLKTKFACGGTIKDDKIELQGDHRNKIKEFLVQEGFKQETISIK
ncbi:stress response translation initiation inhibitor YciH [Candidatus Woesearchaeota archaeon ex4484_78]|nr:MAG: stress response translation initiation inhibitor YciH [Candidatus Woesearchaeota archaeon ex4484_78]